MEEDSNLSDCPIFHPLSEHKAHAQMNRDHHFDPHLLRQLSQLLRRETPEGALVEFLSGLSNARFRTAGYLLGEHIMTVISPADFWHFFLVLVQFHSKAFLVTLMKTLAVRLERGEVSLHDEGFAPLAEFLAKNDEDCRKTIVTLLPHLNEVEDIRLLFRSLGLRDQSLWIPYLMKCSTLPSYYLLFLSLRHVEHNEDFLRRTVYFLIKQGDSLSFNMASLLRSWFGFDDIGGVFSLQLPPYQLSRIEESYSEFCRAIQFL